MREGALDDVPAADTLEQQREQSETVPDAEVQAPDLDIPYLEATGSRLVGINVSALTDDAGRDDLDREDGET